MGAIVNKNTQAEGFHVGTQTPIDDRLVFTDLTDLVNLGVSTENPYKYYEGMRVWVNDIGKEYVWAESATGELATSFSYPTGVFVNGILYGGRDFNFVGTGVTSSGSVLGYSVVVNLVANTVLTIVMGGIGTEIIGVSLYDVNNKDISSGIDIEIDDVGLSVLLESNVGLTGVQVKVNYIGI